MRERFLDKEQLPGNESFDGGLVVFIRKRERTGYIVTSPAVYTNG